MVEFLEPDTLAQNTQTSSLQWSETAPTSVQDMTLNNLMMRFQ